MKTTASLPLRSVTMYKNKVAFVERGLSLEKGTSLVQTAEVHDGDDGDDDTRKLGFSMNIPIPSKDMIVSTLCVQTRPPDASKGITVKYDEELADFSQARTANQQKEHFRFTLGRTKLVDFLSSVVGARVRVRVGTSTKHGSSAHGDTMIEGKLCIVEEVDVALPDNRRSQKKCVAYILGEKGIMEKVMMDEVTSVQMVDEACKEEEQDPSRNSRDAHKKT